MKPQFIICLTIAVLSLIEPLQGQNSKKSSGSNSLPRIINNIGDYRKTVATDSNQRMVKLEEIISPLITNWKYATEDNFTHTILYKNPEAYVRLPVAEMLKKVQAELKKKGLSLLFYDAYRPYSVTQKMWSIVPDSRYAANPKNGSGHNRGTSVDVSLADLKTGEELPMPTAFDDFTVKAHHNYMNLDSTVIANRKLLKTVMEKYGFVSLSTEWWHYSLPNAAKSYALLDLDFEELRLSQK